MATKVMFVDDSEVALDWAKESLQPLGFEVITYNASLGIQSFVRRNLPDIILLDVNMPALRGDMVCSMLKKNPHTQGVIVALYSGMPADELKARADSVGADGYVVKVNDVKELVNQIKDLLK